MRGVITRTSECTSKNDNMGANLHKYNQFDGFAASHHVERCIYFQPSNFVQTPQVTSALGQFRSDHVNLVLVKISPKSKSRDNFAYSNSIWTCRGSVPLTCHQKGAVSRESF